MKRTPDGIATPPTGPLWRYALCTLCLPPRPRAQSCVQSRQTAAGHVGRAVHRSAPGRPMDSCSGAACRVVARGGRLWSAIVPRAPRAGAPQPSIHRGRTDLEHTACGHARLPVLWCPLGVQGWQAGHLSAVSGLDPLQTGAATAPAAHGAHTLTPAALRDPACAGHPATLVHGGRALCGVLYRGRFPAERKGDAPPIHFAQHRLMTRTDGARLLCFLPPSLRHLCYDSAPRAQPLLPEHMPRPTAPSHATPSPDHGKRACASLLRPTPARDYGG